MQNNQIKPNPFFVHEDTHISETVKLMISENVSSVLVTDKEDVVIGIVTERDIVRKFTLVSVEGKLDRCINTIMNRPVLFANVSTIDKDVTRLHKEKKLRHFPILQGTNPVKKNIVGMVSLSDFGRRYLFDERSEADNSISIVRKLPLLIITSQQNSYVQMKGIFETLGYKPKHLQNTREFPGNLGERPGIIFDLDGFKKNEFHKWLVLIKAYKGPVVIACSSPQVVSTFRRYIDKSRRVAIKPIDISYCDWWLSNFATTETE